MNLNIKYRTIPQQAHDLAKSALRLKYYVDKYYDPKKHKSKEGDLISAIILVSPERVRELLTDGLDGLTLPQLRDEALRRGFRGVYSKTKGEIICLLTSSTS